MTATAAALGVGHASRGQNTGVPRRAASRPARERCGASGGTAGELPATGAAVSPRPKASRSPMLRASRSRRAPHSTQ